MVRDDGFGGATDADAGGRDRQHGVDANEAESEPHSALPMSARTVLLGLDLMPQDTLPLGLLSAHSSS
jgi:hypothetical protein